jgi:hypothetical protein
MRAIGRQRLMNLQLAGSRCKSAPQAVAALGALQAQDYAGALWAIALRVPGARLADVERAVRERQIVRSWPLRGTLHFVAAADLRWMLDLLAARVLKAAAKRQHGLALDAATFRKVERVLTRALDGQPLTRDALRDAFTRANISPDGGRLYHCLLYFSLHQLICFAVPDGKQPTFALLDQWLAPSPRLQADQALAVLAARYFTSHGPATQQDFMRWARLTAAEAKRGIAAAQGIQQAAGFIGPVEQVAPNAESKGMFLLPGFDEYILGYRDRSMILDAEHATKIVPGANGVFRPTLVYDGKVVGTWKADASKPSVRITETGFALLSAAQKRAFRRAAEGYAQFLGKTLRAN